MDFNPYADLTRIYNMSIIRQNIYFLCQNRYVIFEVGRQSLSYDLNISDNGDAT